MSINSTNNETGKCHLASAIITPQFKTIVFAECLIAPFAFAPNLMLLRALWRVTVFPTNLRLILGYLSCTFLLFATATLVKGLYILVSPPCAYSFSQRDCRIFDLTTSGLVITHLYFCLASLCIERLYATVRFRHYDKNTTPWLGRILILFSWAILFSIYCNDVFWLPTDLYVPICESNFLPQRSPYLMPGYLGLECVTMSMTIFTYVYNRHVARNMVINRALYDLSARFLVDQNVQINTIVLPSIALHFVAHIPMVSLLIPVNSFGGVSPPVRSLILRGTYVWRLLYAVADPLLAFYLNAHLRQNLERGPFGRVMKRLGVNIGKNKATAVQVHAVLHFDYLEKAWAQHMSGRKVAPAELATAKENGEFAKKAFC